MPRPSCWWGYPTGLARGGGPVARGGCVPQQQGERPKQGERTGGTKMGEGTGGNKKIRAGSGSNAVRARGRARQREGQVAWQGAPGGVSPLEMPPTPASREVAWRPPLGSQTVAAVHADPHAARPVRGRATTARTARRREGWGQSDGGSAPVHCALSGGGASKREKKHLGGVRVEGVVDSHRRSAVHHIRRGTHRSRQ